MSDGGPAFPNPGTYYVKDNKPVTINESAMGMSLRDYFATNLALNQQFMLGISRQQLVELAGREPPEDKEGIEFLDFAIDYSAAIRYRIADAMLKARLK